MSNFLHCHPGTEVRCNLDEHHVIVDKDDWKQAKKVCIAARALLGGDETLADAGVNPGPERTELELALKPLVGMDLEYASKEDESCPCGSGVVLGTCHRCGREIGRIL